MVENSSVTARPLLIFPEAGRAERTKRQGFGGRIHTPNVAQQAERLTPQFQRLQDAMERKRAALQDNTFGIQPEQVLVLETVGSIDNFINAVMRIPGLDWLGEFEHEPFTPEHGFADENNPEKELNGQLFLIMTDQQAQQQLRSLFNQWREAPNTTFPYGLAKLKDAFVHLHTIRPWDAEDRIRETGLLEDWEDRLQSGQELVPFEAELWFRNDAERRQQAESYLRSIIESLDGEVVQRCAIPEVAYHAVLGRMPQAYIQEILAHPGVLEDVRLFQCEGIRHLRPVGQCAVLLPEDVVAISLPEDEEPEDVPVGNPLVALFDGLPLVGHRKLEQRIIVDDPRFLKVRPNKRPSSVLNSLLPRRIVGWRTFKNPLIWRQHGQKGQENPRLFHPRRGRCPSRGRTNLPHPHGLPDHAPDRPPGVGSPGAPPLGLAPQS